ncbi:MAG: hypothetical protein ACYS0E_20835 [Planctomycetota bacterium]|jgi:hypothetical protein
MRTILLLTLLATGAAAGEKIAWYGTWERAKADAARLNRPILLLSAAPQCRNVSGMW